MHPEQLPVRCRRRHAELAPRQLRLHALAEQAVLLHGEPVALRERENEMIRVEGQHGARSYRAVTGHAIVVGAGPAGSVTALLLARSGLDVLLLDRTPFPRPKPCGDCLSAAATGLLSDLGLLDRVLDAGASRLSHWEIVAPDGTRATGRFGDATALALERRHLDLLVLQAAVEAGATFRQTRVTDLLFHDDRVVGHGVHAGSHARVCVRPWDA